MRLAWLPESPPSPSEPTGPCATPCSRPPRRARSIGAWRVPHVRICGRHREALPASPGSEQRRCTGSDSVPPRCASLPQLRAAGRHKGLLRGTPRPPQRPAAGPAAAAGGAGGRRQQGLAAGECPRPAQGRNVALRGSHGENRIPYWIDRRLLYTPVKWEIGFHVLLWLTLGIGDTASFANPHATGGPLLLTLRIIIIVFAIIIPTIGCGEGIIVIVATPTTPPIPRLRPQPPTPQPRIHIDPDLVSPYFYDSEYIIGRCIGLIENLVLTRLAGIPDSQVIQVFISTWQEATNKARLRETFGINTAKQYFAATCGFYW